VTVLLAIVAGVLFASAIYLMLRRSVLKLAVGLSLLANAANLVIFVAAGLTRGEPPLIRRSFELTPEEHADLEDALHAVRKQTGKPLTDGRAFVELVRRALRGGVGTSRTRVVITMCDRCESAVRQVNDGTIAVDRASLEIARISSSRFISSR